MDKFTQRELAHFVDTENICGDLDAEEQAARLFLRNLLLGLLLGGR